MSPWDGDGLFVSLYFVTKSKHSFTSCAISIKASKAKEAFESKLDACSTTADSTDIRFPCEFVWIS
jgi:hypothetical protein